MLVFFFPPFFYFPFSFIGKKGMCRERLFKNKKKKKPKSVPVQRLYFLFLFACLFSGNDVANRGGGCVSKHTYT